MFIVSMISLVQLDRASGEDDAALAGQMAAGLRLGRDPTVAVQ